MFNQKFERGILRDVFGIGGAVQGASSIAAAGIQAGAVTSAAHTQADAAKYAAGLQSQAADKSLAFQQSAFDKSQANQAPWLQAGTGALSALQAGTKDGGSLVAAYPGGPYTPDQFSFNPNDLQNTPGYQFQLNQGMSALEKSQAAQGISNSGGAQKAIENYAQGLAGTTYNTERNAALQAFDTNQNNKLNAYNTNLNEYNVAQSKQLNALQSLAGLGQNATNQVNSSAASFANNAAATLQNGAANAANYTTQGANAAAGGAIGLGNSLAGLSSNLGNMAAYNSLYNSSYAQPQQQLAPSDNSSLGYASLPSGSYDLGQYLG